MIAVADSSPLIVLAKLDCFDLLHRLYDRLYISSEVRHEVVVDGAGLPGSSQVAQADGSRCELCGTRPVFPLPRQSSRSEPAS